MDLPLTAKARLELLLGSYAAGSAIEGLALRRTAFEMRSELDPQTFDELMRALNALSRALVERRTAEIPSCRAACLDLLGRLKA